MDRAVTESQLDAHATELLYAIFKKAVIARASDIHIDPTPSAVRIRFRIDGTMQNQGTLPHTEHDPLIMRMKVLADLDITSKPVPQDGHFEFLIQGLPDVLTPQSSDEKAVQEVSPIPAEKDRMLDVRISIFPTINGEAVVCRILNRSEVRFSIHDLGLAEDSLRKVEQLITRNYGMLLVTGPVGAGKTTALYSILQETMSESKNIVTLEDPVEFHFETIRQIQMQPERGLTFAAGMKSVLRQDPDVILIGEIRDNETAEHAVRASLTGRIVFSTLHSGTSTGTIARLIDMGVERSLIAYAVNGVISTRLVKKTCVSCKVPYEPSEQMLSSFDLNLSDGQFVMGKGCIICGGTGYLGRTGIFEVLEFDDRLRTMIIDGASMEELERYVEQNGMKTLKQDARQKILEGTTTVEMVLRSV
jgi:type IV pilus assembly protein PilB